MNEVIEKLSAIGVVPVVVIDDVRDALPLAEALVKGGLPCAEVTFRTEAAAESIRLMREHFPEMIVGAGTVLTRQNVDDAVQAGARFLVSPGLNEDTLQYALSRHIPMVPGTCTPSDVEKALSFGLTEIKFFPAEASGGLAMIKALCGLYTKVRFMPTGGVNVNNVRDYLSFSKIWAVGGTWVAKKQLIAEQKFDEIERLCREASAIVKEIRG